MQVLTNHLTEYQRAALLKSKIDLEPKDKNPKPEPGRHGYTSLSFNCKRGHHTSCFAKKCQCPCNHVSP